MRPSSQCDLSISAFLLLAPTVPDQEVQDLPLGVLGAGALFARVEDGDRGIQRAAKRARPADRATKGLRDAMGSPFGNVGGGRLRAGPTAYFSHSPNNNSDPNIPASEITASITTAQVWSRTSKTIAPIYQ